MNDNLLVERGLPVHAAKALGRFASVNKHYNGAGWADCLDILRDSDSHLDLTETLYARLEGVVTPENLRLVSPVALTLYYAGVGRLSSDMVRELVNLLGLVRDFNKRLALIRERVQGLPDHPWIPGTEFADGALMEALS